MSYLVALTKRRVPDVAFFDDDETTVTIERPATPIQPTPIPQPELNFEPPEVHQGDPEFAAYAKKAMNGQLPVPEALTQDLNRQEGILIQALLKTKGPGWRTDAASVQAYQEFKSRRTAAEDAARHGNQATTNTILQGLMQETAMQNRAELEVFQAEVAAGMEAYRAQVQQAIENNRAQAANAGRTSTQTRSGSGAGALLGPIGGIAGIGAASFLMNNKRPWWLADSEKTGGTSSGVISPGFGEGGYSITGLGSRFGDPETAGGYSLFDSGGGTSLNLGSDAPQYSIGDLQGFSNQFSLTGTDDTGLFDPGQFNLGSLGIDPSFFADPTFGMGGSPWWDPSQFSMNLGGLDLGGLNFGNLDFGFDMGGLAAMPDLDFAGYF